MHTVDIHIDLSRSGYSQALEMEMRELLYSWAGEGWIATSEAAWLLQDDRLTVRVSSSDPERMSPKNYNRRQAEAADGIRLLTGSLWTVEDLGTDPRYIGE